MQALRTSSVVAVRQLAAVLLQRALFRGEEAIWEALAPATRASVAAALLEAVPLEAERNVRHSICDAIAAVASALMDDETRGEDWPALWGWMHAAVGGATPVVQEAGFRVFERVAAIVAKRMQSSFDSFRGLFLARIGDASAPLDVRVAAALAAAALLACIESISQTESFAPIIPAMLELLAASASRGEDEVSRQVAGALVDVAGTAPTVFKPVLPAAVALLSQIGGNPAVDGELRRAALEVLVTLSESAASIVRKMGGGAFLAATLPVALGMVREWGELEDGWEADWELSDDLDDIELTETEGRQVEVGEEALDRLATAIGAAKLLPAIAPMIPPLLGDGADWRAR
jgi:importin-5